MFILTLRVALFQKRRFMLNDFIDSWEGMFMVLGAFTKCKKSDYELRHVCPPTRLPPRVKQHGFH